MEGKEILEKMRKKMRERERKLKGKGRKSMERNENTERRENVR